MSHFVFARTELKQKGQLLPPWEYLSTRNWKVLYQRTLVHAKWNLVCESVICKTCNVKHEETIVKSGFANIQARVLADTKGLNSVGLLSERIKHISGPGWIFINFRPILGWRKPGSVWHLSYKRIYPRYQLQAFGVYMALKYNVVFEPNCGQ